MAPTCPIDIARKIERRWESRAQAAAPRSALGDNPAGDDGVRPDCQGYATIGPSAAE